MPLIWNEKSIVIVQSLPPINWCMSVKHGSESMVTQSTRVTFQKQTWTTYNTCCGPNFSPGLLICPLSRHKWSIEKVDLIWSWCKLSTGKILRRSVMPCPDTTRGKEHALIWPSLWAIWAKLLPPLLKRLKIPNYIGKTIRQSDYYLKRLHILTEKHTQVPSKFLCSL